MKQAIVTLWGKYKYKISLEGNETMQQIAFKIALEVHKKENRPRFTGNPRTYQYILKCLKNNSCLNFRINTNDSENNEQELFKAVNYLNSQSEFVKKECGLCQGKGFMGNIYMGGEDKDTCVICGGSGYFYEHQDYRLGYTFSNTLVIDIDGKDQLNLINVKKFYENVLKCKFKIFSTKKGYWLFSDKKYYDIESWLYDHCKVLSPRLEIGYLYVYLQKLLALDSKEGEFTRATPEVIKKSGLYCAPEVLNFDIAFTFLSIKRERSTIRITKKGKDDKIEQISI